MVVIHIKSEFVKKMERMAEMLHLALEVVIERAWEEGICSLERLLPGSVKGIKVELKQYFREHAARKTVEELATDLCLKPSTVRVYLSRLKLRASRPALKNNSAAPVKQKSLKPSCTAVKQTHIADTIKEYFLTETDEQIALRLGESIKIIQAHRRKLCLKRPTSFFSSEGPTLKRIKEIGSEAIENMLTREGYMSTDVTKELHIRVSRERFRQLMVKLNIKHSVEDRVTPDWDIQRLARQQGNMNLANKEWLNEQLQSSRGIADLGAKLGVDYNRLARIIHLHKLTYPSFRKYGREVVELTCAGCGKTFKRLKRWVDQKVRKSPNSRFNCKPGCGNTKLNLRRHGHHAGQKEHERCDFVQQNWTTMTDEEMANHLKVSISSIKRHRYELGLHYDSRRNRILSVLQS